MSYDYTVYIQHIERFSCADCEAFLRARGLEAHIPADFDPLTHGGMLELGAVLPKATEAGEVMRSGFEYDISAHEFEPIPPRRPTLWERLRGVKPTAEEDPYPAAVWDVFLSCHWLTEDVWAIPLALGFAGYLVATCDGVLFDPQEGKIFADLGAIEAGLRLCIEEAEEAE